MAQAVVYVTAASREQALAIGRTVVAERLAACVNVLGPITSIYRWEGLVHEEEEVGFLLKTRGDLVEALSERVKALHDYECPCVVAIPIDGGNPAFLAWIDAECADAG